MEEIKWGAQNLSTLWGKTPLSQKGGVITDATPGVLKKAPIGKRKPKGRKP